MPDPTFSLDAAIEALQRIRTTDPNRKHRLVVRKHNPGGMTAHQTTEVQGIFAGFDWEAGRVIIEPALPMTELTPEQVGAIEQSMRDGRSWHAEQARSALRERALKAEARVAELEQQLQGIQQGLALAEAAAPAAMEPPLIGRWHHGQGYLVSGTIRIASWDCDTDPPEEFRDRLLDWVCDTLNAAVQDWGAQARRGDRRADSAPDHAQHDGAGPAA